MASRPRAPGGGGRWAASSLVLRARDVVCPVRVPAPRPSMLLLHPREEVEELLRDELSRNSLLVGFVLAGILLGQRLLLPVGCEVEHVQEHRHQQEAVGGARDDAEAGARRDESGVPRMAHVLEHSAGDELAALGGGRPRRERRSQLLDSQRHGGHPRQEEGGSQQQHDGVADNADASGQDYGGSS